MALKSPPRTSLQLESPCSRDAALPQASKSLTLPGCEAAPTGSAFRALHRIAGGFHSTPPDSDQPPGRAESGHQDPRAAPYRCRRSARSGWSSLCRGAPNLWTWSHHCERQGMGLSAPMGAQGAPPHRWGRTFAIQVTFPAKGMEKSLPDCREREEQHQRGWDSGEKWEDRRDDAV